MDFAIDFETAFGILQYVFDPGCYYTTIEQRRRIPKFCDEVIEMKHHPVREWFRKYRSCEICGKRACFGVTIGKGIRCKSHMETWMENVIDKKCFGKEGKKCKTRPTFGWPGQDATHCENCKSDGMKDIKNKKCLHKGCEKRAQFGHLGQSSQFCSEHKIPGMKNLTMMTNGKMCTFIDENGVRCESTRYFGYSGGKREFCGIHYLKGMINLGCQLCKVCGKRAQFGYFNDRQYLRCEECKVPGMINLARSYCSCGFQANFNYPSNKPAFCSQCKQPGMIYRPTHRCESKGCTEIASFGVLKPAHCSLHKQPLELDLSERICVRCSRLDVVNSEGLCINFCLATDQYYAQYRNKSQRLVKQNEIVAFLTANGYAPHLVDVMIDKTCNKYRPDIVFEFDGHAIIIEVDENQHARYIGRNCEFERMEALFRTFRKQLLFIRYNPDTFRVNNIIQRVEKKARQQILLNTLKKYLPGFPFDFGGVYLFYDGWQRDGDNLISFPFPDNCDQILRTVTIARS